MSESVTNARRMLHLLDRLRRQQHGPAIMHLAALNLSMSHMRIMHLLVPDRVLAMKDLADQLQLTPPSVTALTRRLSQTGLVQRQTYADDSRVVLLSLTEAGRALHEQLYAEQLQRMEQLLVGLNPLDQDLFLDLLDRATRPLDAEQPVPSAENAA